MHNLMTTHPENGVNVAAYNYQNQQQETGITDSQGQTRLKITSGKPFYLIVWMADRHCR